jgi:hypothetical protein
MLLSHSHCFIFIHVFKTGVISIRAALEPYLQLPSRSRWRRIPQRLRLPGFRPLPGPDSHLRAVEARALLPAWAFGGYFKFAFVRNPWDWHVSFYHYVLEHPEHHRHALVSRMRDFEAYLTWRVYNARELQKHYVADQEGGLLVDFVGRFENLRADFAAVCSRIGVAVSLPHLNRSRHRDYRSYYTASTADLVQRFWGEEIDFFGYRFDPEMPVCATRAPVAPRMAA